MVTVGAVGDDGEHIRPVLTPAVCLMCALRQFESEIGVGHFIGNFFLP